MQKSRPVRRSLVALVSAGVLAASGGALLTIDQASAAPPAVSVDDADAYPVLKSGSHGAQVTIAQSLLREKKQQVEVDGSYGSATDKAVRAFQAQQKIKVDGVIGKETWSKLLVVAESGSSGEAVKGLQRGLNDKGHKVGVNGSFDSATEKAVKAFQDSRGLDVDGVAGPNTWGALLGVKGDSGASGGDPADKTDKTPTGSPGADNRYPNPKKTFANGKVPDDQLCRVPGAKSDQWRMSCRAVPDFMAMNDAYRKQFGHDLQVDHLSLTGYRTVGDQQVLWNKYGSGQAARPGTSNHGWGMALDLNMNRDGAGSHQSKTYKWLHANGPRYGFADTVPHEDWHFDYQR